MRRFFQVLLVAAFLLSGVLSQTKGARLQMVVALAGEDGVIAVRDRQLSMYSDGNIRLKDAVGPNWSLQQKVKGAVTLEFDSGGWKHSSNAIGLESAFAPQLCDVLNQIDLKPSPSELRAVLPPGAKIKLLRSIDQEVVLTVFSTSNSTVRYDVRISLLRRSSRHSYDLVANELVTDAGTFCGVQHLENKRYALLTDEPAGSSDYLGIYVYDVR